MSSFLDEACAILDDFEKRIAGVKAIWAQLAEDNPNFEQVDSKNWQEKSHRIWLHGATDAWECNELERWLYDHKMQGHPLNGVTGCKDLDLSGEIYSSAFCAIASLTKSEETAMNVMLQSLHDFKPQDAVEARLVAQASVAFSHAMSLVRKGTNSDMLCHLEPLTNLAIKFMRVHNETVEALTRYRRGGEQKVTVTHVAEKMAVVNNYGCQGEGVIHKNQGENPCSESAAQKPEQMVISHVASPQWPMEDAGCMVENAQVQKPKKDAGE